MLILIPLTACVGCNNAIESGPVSKDGMTDDGKPVPPEAKNAPGVGGGAPEPPPKGAGRRAKPQ